MSEAFKVLGLPETATPEEVKVRWRELVKTCHPDRPGGNAVVFNDTRRAYLEAYAIATAPKMCGVCHGSRKLTHQSGFSIIQVACPACGGTGVQS